MNAPRDLGPDFRSWLRDVPPMPDELPERTLDHTSHTPQRRRWLWFLPGPKPSAGTDGGEGQPVGPALSNRPSGPMPARPGRTFAMFSATKMIGITAAIALLGAVIFISEPGSPPVASPAESDPTYEPREATSFTGTAKVLGQDRTTSTERLPWGNVKLGEQFTLRSESDDPRRTGLGTYFHNVYELGSAKTSLRSIKGLMKTRETDEGWWIETGSGFPDTETGAMHYHTYGVGKGTYEGLYAFALCDQPANSVNFDCRGIIFEGGMPEMPEDAPSEIPSIHLAP